MRALRLRVVDAYAVAVELDVVARLLGLDRVLLVLEVDEAEAARFVRLRP